MSDTHLEALITQRLSALTPAHLVLSDQSDAHKGHAGAMTSGGGHYHLCIISDTFYEMNRLQRHRLVYNYINDLIPHQIHAIGIEAFTTREWLDKQKERL